MKFQQLFLILSQVPAAWGVRVDTNDLFELGEGVTASGAGAEAGGADVSTNESIQMTISKDYRVAGHTNLAQKTTFRVRAEEDGTCKDVLEKFKRLAEAEAEEPGDDTDAGKLLTDLDSKEGGTKVEEDIEAVENKADLVYSAMKLGEVITMTDQNKMVECTTGEDSALMEHAKTAAGKKLFQGDMLVNEGEEGKAVLAEIQAGHRYAGTPWPNGEVPYCVSANAPQQMRHAVSTALSHIQSQVPCIKFRNVHPISDRTGKERCRQEPAIFITAAEKGACYSYVGLIGGSQTLNVGQGCWTLGIVAHEIGHSLGMAHEQSRPDRDQYVQILWQNIQKGMENNFEIERGAYKDDTYDAYSLMHYAQYDFSVQHGYLKTIDASNPQIGQIMGQREGFSEQDIKLLGEIYGCKARVTPKVRNEELAKALITGRSPAPGPSPFNPHPSTIISNKREHSYIKIVFERVTGLRTPDGAYAQALTGNHALITRVSRDLYWGREEGKLVYSKGAAVTFQLFGPDKRAIFNPVSVSSRYFFPSGQCNTGCDLKLSEHSRLRVCIGFCNHLGCGCVRT